MELLQKEGVHLPKVIQYPAQIPQMSNADQEPKILQRTDRE